METDTELLIERGQLRRISLKRAGIALVAILFTGGVVTGIVFAITSTRNRTSHSKPDTNVQEDLTKRPHSMVPTTRTPNLTTRTQTTVPTTSTPECSSPGCLLAASRIINATDDSIDPCENMYQFACGKWMENHPNYYGQTGIFFDMETQILHKLKALLEIPTKDNELEAFRKAKQYYQACMKEDEIEKMNLTQLLSELTSLGGWPVLGHASGGLWKHHSYNTMQLLADVFIKVGILPIVQVQTGKNVLEFSEPSTAMPNREYYLQGRDDRTLKAYENYAVEMAKALGADEHTAISDMRNMVDLEIDLAKIMADKHEVGGNVVAELPDLPSRIPEFEWKTFLTKLFGTVGITLDFRRSYYNYDFPSASSTVEVIVFGADYYRKLSRTLSSHSSRTVANYVIWRCIQSWITFLPKNLRDLQFVYNQATTGATLPTPRWSTCTATTQAFFSEVIGRMYVDAYFDERLKPDMKAFVHSLRTTFKSEMKSMTWMDLSTRMSAIRKLDAMTLKIGYPEILKEDSYLNDITSKLTIGSLDPFTNNKNVVNALATKALNRFQDDPDERNSWTMSPAEFNAENDLQSNSFIFPAAIVEPPFFREDMPKYMLYGGLGSIVGHEMTHGFDTSGRYYDSTGSFNDWWSASSERHFNERVKCLVDQYNNFQEPQSKMHLDGNYTSGENIADNGGIKESYGAYQKWVKSHGEEGKLPGLNYTTDQLFFISTAQVWCSKITPQMAKLLIRTDVHSLAQFRVTGMMQNSIEFANAFNCPSGSYMNPRKKCIVW